VREVLIAGVGQTPVNKNQDLRGRYLGADAIRAALADAGIEPAEVGALYVGNMLSGVLAQQQQLGALLADYAGLAGIEAVTIEAACASGGAALRAGYLAVASGAHDTVVVCGVERMTHVERDTVTRALATAADWELEGVCGESFLSLNALLMRAYMAKYHVTAEQFAPFAIAAHRHALTNEHALFRKAIDRAMYATSRLVSDPIRLFDVSPICNGAAAVVLTAREAGRTRTLEPRIRVAGSALATASLALARRADPLWLDAVTRSTQAAMRQAGVAHSDVDLFELHDAYTIMTTLSLEAAGFASAGAGLSFADEARIGLEGELPLATFGGLKARGHPVGASGCYQVVEAYLQLAGRAGANQVPNATVALTQNIGGTGATVVSHVLARDA
jgi:acetyl-CoA C-acetyltransferase